MIKNFVIYECLSKGPPPQEFCVHRFCEWIRPVCKRWWRWIAGSFAERVVHRFNPDLLFQCDNYWESRNVTPRSNENQDQNNHAPLNIVSRSIWMWLGHVHRRFTLKRMSHDAQSGRDILSHSFERDVTFLAYVHLCSLYCVCSLLNLLNVIRPFSYVEWTN